VEKALKAVLVASGAEIAYTHDLSFLLELLDRSEQPPDEVANADWLTPWAVAARYGAPVSTLDRTAAVAVATTTVAWAEKRTNRVTD
jgi:HEPN domain-containing protein